MELFKKINRQKNNTKFRKKTFVDDEAEIATASISTDQVQEAPASNLQVPETLEAPQIVKPKKPHKSAGISLSFGDDDDTKVPAFKIKKSSASKKLAKYKLKELEGSYVSYDEDTLSILRKQQESANSQIEKNISALSSGNDFWIDEIGNNETVIPDANHIFLAKKKREKIRQGIFDQDEEDPFLSKGYVSLAAKGDPNADFGSRLVREDDEIGDGEEELNLHMGERMSLKKGDMKEQLKKQAQDEMQKALEEFDNLGDSDEEFATIERNRLRQAIGGSKVSLC
ncbi:hypothetical protein DSO57_1027459 [Entomophthora muscae]|uniref:Uncharacterized protein n=1 Tax=Entomophthora muscae TaxID=34485 RepID=A0ACC2RST1_9FUNG|nr:hypothetical protein DSO57_1027459 [Entomophthora muscae]